MAKPIIEQVLGTTNPYSENYNEAVIRLVKSMTFLSKREAILYNGDVVKATGKPVTSTDLSTWRYFRHLSGLYHEIDKPMKVISRDTREEIVITIDTLSNHLETHRELNKFGVFFDEVSSKYPDQMLLLKTIMTLRKDLDIYEIIKMPNWTIIAWNSELIEPQEEDVIPKLQDRIYKFARKQMRTNYSLTNDLFMAGLYIVLANVIVKWIYNIRLGNAKTGRAHSYHMLNYFASHHGLDASYDFIDSEQRFFLYRNLLYLDSHAGSNEVMDILIEKFFTYKRISVTNYEFYQNDDIRENHQTDYRYKQTLLNKDNIAFNDTRYNLDELSEKEIKIVPPNRKEYYFNKNRIDFRQVHSKASTLLTKDLEINLSDSTDEVKYKLIDLLTDYWAVTIDSGKNNVFIEFINPINGNVLELVAKDAFNLYVIAIHLLHRIKLDVIPNYWSWRVYKEDIPSLEFMMGAVASKEPRVREMIDYLRTRSPNYRVVSSKREFRDYVEAIYRYELGQWIILSREGNLPIYTDIEVAMSNMYRQWVCSNGGENVNEFLARIGLRDIVNYNETQFSEFIIGLLNTVGDGILSRIDVNILTQKAATDIFNKFKSYSTQLLSEYTSNESLLIGCITPRFNVTDTKVYDSGVAPIDTPIICVNTHMRTDDKIDISFEDRVFVRGESEDCFVDEEVIRAETKDLSLPNYIDETLYFCVEDDSPPKRLYTIQEFNKFQQVFQE